VLDHLPDVSGTPISMFSVSSLNSQPPST
jgi:hypothetical protein